MFWIPMARIWRYESYFADGKEMIKWHHAGIQVVNLAESIQFYEKMFGFKVEQTFQFQREKIVFLIKEDLKIELIELKDEQTGTFNSIHLSWQVEDLEKWIKNLKENGLEPSEGPYSLKNGWQTVFYEGINHEIIELIEINS